LTITLYDQPCTYVIGTISLNSSWNEKCFRKKVADDIKTNNLDSKFFFRKSCHLWENVQTYRTAR